MKPVQPVVLRQAAQQMEAGPLSRSPTWVSVALTSQPSPMCPSRLVLFQGSSLHGRQAAPSSAGEVGRGSGGPGGGAGGAGGQTQSFLPQLGQTRSPGHFCSGLACGRRGAASSAPSPSPSPSPQPQSAREEWGARTVGLQQMFAGLAHGSWARVRAAKATSRPTVVRAMAS